MEEIRKEKEREIEKRRLPELTSQRDKMRARISALERRLNELTESDGAPRAYANIETLNALIGYLENKRADSLKEAINLWVGEKKIEEIQQRQEEIEERKKDDLLRLTNPLAWNEKHGIYIPHTESVYKESPFGDKLITYENGKKVGVVYSDGSSKFYKDGKWVFDKNKNTHGGL
ncbi:MAG: hypothetical protein LBP62_02370 [Clostridiales bacterium]|nr:hypothetical protein [Clostridiales bacterium]